METLPERQDPIKSFLSWFMSDEDVARYSDPSYAIEMVKRGELCWQAAVSIGVHALVFGHFGTTDEEKALVKNLAGYALEPMEALHESFTQRARQQPLTDEEARVLFHLRFALGFLFQFGTGDPQRALAFLHEMAATQLSRFAGGVEPAGSIVSYTDDMRRAKDLAAYLICDLCTEMDHYEETLSLLTQAAGETGDPLGLLQKAGDLLDRWAVKCEAIEQREGAAELDAWNEWCSLLGRAAALLAVSSSTDPWRALPGECRQESAQFLAYKFGQLAARFAAKNAHLWQDYMEESEQPGGADFLVEAVLCDLEARPDWHNLRARYVTGWRRTPVYDGRSVEDIGPAMDLYWAMRIGFADEMLQSTRALEVAAPQVPPLPSSLSTLFSQMKDMLGTANVRLQKQGRELGELRERLPPTKEEIELFLDQRLGRLCRELPSDVTDALISAEYGYRAGWQSAIPTRAVLKGFHDAVEACFEWYFERPFGGYLKEGHLFRTMVHWGVWRDQPQRSEFHAHNPRSLSLGRWAGAFEVLMDADLSADKNLEVADFLRYNWPDLGKDALRELAGSLRKVQAYRNRAEHPQSPPRPHHAERSELEEMRKLVLGVAGSPSVIVQIYRLLAPSKQP